MYSDHNYLAEVIGQAHGFLKENDFREVDEGGGDRAGTWEFVWARCKGAMNHYVTIDFTLNEVGQYEVEVWAGISTAKRFRRELIWESEPSSKTNLLSFITLLQAKTEIAIRMIENWQEKELPYRCL